MSGKRRKEGGTERGGEGKDAREEKEWREGKRGKGKEGREKRNHSQSSIYVLFQVTVLQDFKTGLQRYMLP